MLAEPISSPTTIAQGTSAAATPAQNGTIVVARRPGGLRASCIQPQQIITMVAAATTIRAVTSVTPV